MHDAKARPAAGKRGGVVGAGKTGAILGLCRLEAAKQESNTGGTTEIKGRV